MTTKLYTGDVLKCLAKLPDESVDAVVTDPPYSSGTRREGQKGIRKSMLRGVTPAEWFSTDALSTNGFWWLLHSCAVEWKRILKPGGHLLSFIDWRMAPHMAGAIESADLRHYGTLVWDKTYFGMGSHFRNQHELILHFTQGTGRDAIRHDVGNVLRFKPIRHGDHPTQKPVDLIEALISVIVPEGGMVLDPFMGSGTTGVACKQLGRNFIGIDLNPKYNAIARKRIAAAKRIALSTQHSAFSTI